MSDSIVAPLVVLSTPTCHRCKAVARKLTEAGVDHEYLDVTDPINSEWRDRMVERGLTQVPQTVRGDTWVEGFDPDALERLF